MLMPGIGNQQEHNDVVVTSMSRSLKLGATSALLLVSALVPPFLNWREPISFACIGLSGLLGLLAAQQGSKWWLTIPGIIVGALAFCIYLGFHSF